MTAPGRTGGTGATRSAWVEPAACTATSRKKTPLQRPKMPSAFSQQLVPLTWRIVDDLADAGNMVTQQDTIEHLTGPLMVPDPRSTAAGSLEKRQRREQSRV